MLLFYLLLVLQYGVTMLTCTDAPGVDHVAHEDAAVAHLARVSHLQDHLHCRLHQRIATDDGQRHTLYHVR